MLPADKTANSTTCVCHAGDITSILLTSATKTGIYANTAIYGQGLLNLDAATRPIGTLSLAGSTSTTGIGATQISSVFAAPSGATGAVVVDSYKRGYSLATSALAIRDRDGFDLSTALSRFGTGTIYQDSIELAGKTLHFTSFVNAGEQPWRTDQRRAMAMHSDDGWAATLGMGVDGATALGLTPGGLEWSRLNIADRSFGQGHAGLVQNAVGGALTIPLGGAWMSLGYATGQPGRDGVQSSYWPGLQQAGDQRSQQLFSAAAGVQPLANLRLTGNLGYLREQESILGNRQSGAYSFGASSHTMFVGLGGELGLGGGFALFGSYEIGRTTTGGASGELIGNVSSIRSNAWRVGVKGEDIFDQGDRLMFSFSQPLAASGGTLTTVTPVGYDGFTGDVTYQTSSGALAPAHRESVLQAAYAAMLAPSAQLSVGAMVRLNPDNQKAPPQAVGIARLSLQY